MAALRRFVGVALRGASTAGRCLSTSAPEGSNLQRLWNQSPLAMTMLTMDSKIATASVSAKDAWMSPLAVHYMKDTPLPLSPLCVANIEKGLEALGEREGAAPAMYADSVRRKRKHKMNKHKHRKRLKLQRR